MILDEHRCLKKRISGQKFREKKIQFSPTNLNLISGLDRNRTGDLLCKSDILSARQADVIPLDHEP